MELEMAKNSSPQNRVTNNLRLWMNRYLNEGVTDDLLNDLNVALHEIRYSKYIFPLDVLPSQIGFPQNGYVAKYDTIHRQRHTQQMIFLNCLLAEC